MLIKKSRCDQALDYLAKRRAPEHFSFGIADGALQTIFHLCIPNKDLTKPHF